MADLNATAKATLKSAGVSPEEWARAWYSTGGTWAGDACGCPDNRCMNGFHHRGETDCGCLGVLLEQYLAGESIFACAVTAKLGGTTYPCREHVDHDGARAHHFALHWPACPAPWCRLEPGHRELHDIPSGKPKITASQFGRNRIVALCTLQFHSGGLLDSEPVDDYAVHLVCQAATGTPGPTLCGIDRFAEGSAGWSVGGGISGPGVIHKPCPGCAKAARARYPGLPVAGRVGAAEMAAELEVEVTRA